jgi:hypothetical protein
MRGLRIEELNTVYGAKKCGSGGSRGHGSHKGSKRKGSGGSRGHGSRRRHGSGSRRGSGGNCW